MKTYDFITIRKSNHNFRALTNAGFEDLINSTLHKYFSDEELVNFRPDSYGFGFRFGVEIETSWSVSVRIDLRTDRDFERRTGTTDGKKVIFYELTPVPEISWSSTIRSINSALTSMKLYERAINCLAEIAAKLEEYHLVEID